MSSFKFPIFLAVILLSAFLAVACSSSDEDASPDGDTPVNGDNDLPVDGDKPADGDTPADGDNGGIIIPPDGDDEPQVECRVDADCPTGDNYCDPELNKCRRRKFTCEPCEEHKECGYDQDYCLPSGLCGRSCIDVNDCSVGYDCEVVPEFGARQCVFDMTQTDGVEGNNCCTNENCTAPLVCFPLTAKCTSGCNPQASNCPTGMICYDDPADDRDPYCTYGCNINEECPAGEICFEHQCHEGDCSSKYDCPLEYLCNTTGFSCYPGCEDDEDCYASNECISGQCVERIGCEGTWQCSIGEICSEELPDGDPEDRGCCFDAKAEQSQTSDGRVCPNIYGAQKFCDACTDTQNQNQECGADNVCVELQDQDGNSKGHFCLIKWDCTYQDGENGVTDQGTRQCPRGYGCIKIESDQLNGKFCMADCTAEHIP